MDKGLTQYTNLNQTLRSNFHSNTWHSRFDVRHCWCYSPREMWHSVDGRVFPDVQKDCNSFRFRLKFSSLLGLLTLKGGGATNLQILGSYCLQIHHQLWL